MLNKLRIKSKIILGFLVPVTLLVFVSVGVYIYTNRVIGNHTWVIHTVGVIAEVKSLGSALIDMETGERGFLFSGDEIFLEPYTKGKENFHKQIKLLLEKVNDNPVQVRNLNELAELQMVWDKEINHREIQLRKDSAKGVDNLDNLVADFRKGLGKEKMDKMRTKINEIVSIEESLNLKRSAESNANASFLISFTMISTLIAIILSLIIGFYIAGTISEPINNLITISQKLAVGNLQFDIEINSQDEVGILADAFKTIKSSLMLLTVDSLELVKAAVDGKLSTRADATKHQGDYRKIVEGVNQTLDSVIGPLNVAADYVDKISRGAIPAKITNTYNGDFNVIKNNLNNAIDNVNALVADAGMLAKAAVEGKLATRADATKHQGDYRKIVEGVNNTLDSVIGPLNVAADYVDKISRGAIPAKITDTYNGDFNVIKNNLNNAIDNVNALVADAGMLAKAAVEGKLATRADATKHQGDYRKIVEGVNNTLDSVIGPLNVAADYVDKISRGAIPNKITDTYNGDFNVIKNNLNNAIENVNALVADANMLSIAAVEGKLATRADATKHQGDYRKIVEGVNKTLDAVIGPLNVAADYVDKISRGAIPSKITDSYNGDFNTLKNNLNRCIENVNALVADAGMLAKAAIDGKLATRADANKHEGDFRKIVDGVNNTLDAVILPVQEAAGVLVELSKGNLKTRMMGDYKGDHATIKTALNSSLVTLNEYVGEISRVLSSMSAGDLTVEVTKDFTGDFAEIKKALTLIVDSFNELIGEIINASDQILISSRQVADSSQSLSQGSNEQASSVEEITATLAVIELKAKDNAKNAKDASNQAMSVKDQAVASNNEMKGMLKAMEEISDTSENIAKIIKEIDAIAFQTNILALNAAVEAARAGQHGKGFNVVAEEVRNLASRSANAAKETTKMIEGSIKTVRSGMDIAGRTANELNKMTAGVVDVTELVKDIASASIEQSSSVVETTSGINQISQVTMSAAATAEESSAASLELSSQAEAFQAMVKRFQIKKSRDDKKNSQSSTKRKIDLK